MISGVSRLTSTSSCFLFSRNLRLCRRLSSCTVSWCVCSSTRSSCVHSPSAFWRIFEICNTDTHFNLQPRQSQLYKRTSFSCNWSKHHGIHRYSSCDCNNPYFFLRCYYDLKKLPVKLSAVYQQVLLYWKMIYKHNFSSHNVPLWNCRYAVFRNKSLFLRK